MSTSVLYDFPGPKARRRELIGSVVGGLVLLAVLALVVAQLSRAGVLDGDRWAVFWDPPKNQTPATVWGGIGRGLWATIQAALYAAPMALALGLFLAVWRTARLLVVRLPSIIVIELFRGLPVLLMMFFGVLALKLTPLGGVVFGLVVYNMAIFAEIFRAGLHALPKGQREAAAAIGLTRGQSLFLIQLPQAVRMMLPSLISQLVVLLKDSSLGFIIGYAELLRTLQNLRDYFGSGGIYIFPLFFVGAGIYILINFLLSRLAVWTERTLARRGARPSKALAAGRFDALGAGTGTGGGA